MPHALIVDEDPASRAALSALVARDGYTTAVAGSLAEARARCEPVPDLVLVDLVLPDGSGMELLSDPALAHRSDIVLIAPRQSAAGQDAVQHPGAFDYLTRPLDLRKLRGLLTRVGQASALPRSAFGPLVGASPPMQKLYATTARIAPTDATVLIVGESGTGKELVARTLHAHSSRSDGPFLAVNCAALSPALVESEFFGHERGSFAGATRPHAGAFERANGGTLFLDEVTEMPSDLQVRLLRVLETGAVHRVGAEGSIVTDVRVIAAANRDPWQAVREGRLREDLFHRLQVVPLYVPPLRERRSDVALLARHFLRQLNDKAGTAKSFSHSALARLERHEWPGNVRELCNVVQRAWILAEGAVIAQPVLQRDAVLGNHVPATSFTVSVGDALADVERRLILSTVQRCRTRDEAARMLGISTKTLYNKLRAYDAGEPRHADAPDCVRPAGAVRSAGRRSARDVDEPLQ